jgi:hypothetical protein
MPAILTGAVVVALTGCAFYLLYMLHQSLRAEDWRKTVRLLVELSPPGTVFTHQVPGHQHSLQVTVGPPAAPQGYR